MFVIYKENIIPGVGGIHPQGIETDLASYNGWVLANCPTEKIHSFKEFDFIACGATVANGLMLVDSIIEETEDEEALAPGDSAFTFSEKDESDIEN